MMSPCVRLYAAVANATNSQLQAAKSAQLFSARFDALEIAHEQSAGLAATLRIRNAQQGARVRGAPAFAAVGQGLRSAAQLADGHDLAQQRPRRGRSERHRHRRLDQFSLMLDPPAARLDLAGIGFVVDPPLPTQHELEMLDG